MTAVRQPRPPSSSFKTAASHHAHSKHQTTNSTPTTTRVDGERKEPRWHARSFLSERHKAISLTSGSAAATQQPACTPIPARMTPTTTTNTIPTDDSRHEQPLLEQPPLLGNGTKVPKWYHGTNWCNGGVVG